MRVREMSTPPKLNHWAQPAFFTLKAARVGKRPLKLATNDNNIITSREKKTD